MGGYDIFGTQSVTAAHDDRLPVFFGIESALDIEVERFTERTGLFRAVEHGNLLDGFGEITEEMFKRERTIQMNCQQTDLFAFGVQIIYSFFDDVTDGTHGNNDTIGIRSAVIIKQVIFTTGQLFEFGHIPFNDFRQRVIVTVGNFAFLEIDVRILRCTADYRMIGVQRPTTESGKSILVNQFGEVIIFESFNFLHFM